MIQYNINLNQTIFSILLFNFNCYFTCFTIIITGCELNMNKHDLLNDFEQQGHPNKKGLRQLMVENDNYEPKPTSKKRNLFFSFIIFLLLVIFSLIFLFI